MSAAFELGNARGSFAVGDFDEGVGAVFGGIDNEAVAVAAGHVKHANEGQLAGRAHGGAQEWLLIELVEMTGGIICGDERPFLIRDDEADDFTDAARHGRGAVLGRDREDELRFCWHGVRRGPAGGCSRVLTTVADAAAVAQQRQSR